MHMGKDFPPVEKATLYGVLLGLAIGLGILFVIVSFAGSPYLRLIKQCKKISKSLALVPAVKEDNLEFFTNECFGKKCPRELSNSWKSFLKIKYGYPSEVLTKSAVLPHSISFGAVMALLYVIFSFIIETIIGINLVAITSAKEMATGLFLTTLFVLIFAGIMLLEMMLMQFFANKIVVKMQDDLDRKVLIQNLKPYVADTEGLTDIANELENMAMGYAQKDNQTNEMFEEPIEENVFDAKAEKQKRKAEKKSLKKILKEKEERFAKENIVEENNFGSNRNPLPENERFENLVKENASVQQSQKEVEEFENANVNLKKSKLEKVQQPKAEIKKEKPVSHSNDDNANKKNKRLEELFSKIESEKEAQLEQEKTEQEKSLKQDTLKKIINKEEEIPKMEEPQQMSDPRGEFVESYIEEENVEVSEEENKNNKIDDENIFDSKKWYW